MNSTPVYVLNSIFKSIATLVIMFLVLLITLSAAKAFSASSKTKIPKARYVDGYYSCETRTNDRKEESVFEIAGSFQDAQRASLEKCETTYGRSKCYPFSFCMAISGNVPFKCTVLVGNEEFVGRGVDWEKAENNARLQCALSHGFVTCLNAYPGTCVRSDAGVIR